MVDLISLSSFKTYSTEDKADVLLKKYVRNRRCNLDAIICDLQHNEAALQCLLSTLNGLLLSVPREDEFYEDVYRYVNHLVRDADRMYKVTYGMHVRYRSPGGRNSYAKDWYWTLADLKALMFFGQSESSSQQQVQFLSVSNGSWRDDTQPSHWQPVSDCKCLSVQCFEYLQTHKCWSAADYIHMCQQMGKKKVPGCYIIQNQVNGTIYVGQSADLMRRVQEHLNGKQSGGDQLDYDIAVLGHDVLIKHIPLAKSGYLDLNEMERDLIRAYDCIEPKGYNKTRGNGY